MSGTDKSGTKTNL